MTTPEDRLATAPSLRAALQARADAASRSLDPETRATLDAYLAWLKSGVLSAATVTVGQPFPPFMLADTTGHLVALDTLLGDGPLVVVFYRGGWCPYCSLALAAWQQAYPELRAAGGRLVAVGPDTGRIPAETVETRRLGFPVLSDPDNGLALGCGLMFHLPEPVQALYRRIGVDMVELHGNNAWTLPVPATFVLDRAGIVRFAHVDPDYRTRAEPSVVIAAVAGLVGEG